MAGKLYGTVIVTYRCNAHCNMCDCFKYPTRPEEEITLDVIRKLPDMAFTNITGGEPFIRRDMPDIVRELYKNRTGWLFLPTDISQTESLIYAGNFQGWEYESVLRDLRKQMI